MEPTGRKEFIKKAGIAAIGLAAVLPLLGGEKSETKPKNIQLSFKITAQPKMEV